jgi:nucleoside 2-deoxyribosyltransferase
MRVIRYETPKEEVQALEGPVVFLAGPTVRGNQTHLQPSWRFAAVDEFKKQGFEGTLILPEFTSITESDKHRPDLPLWEYEGLKRADCILFWVPRTRELIALTTNWELGYWVGREREKVVFGRPDDAYRIAYSTIMWNKVHEEDSQVAKVYNTLESTIEASIAKAIFIREFRKLILKNHLLYNVIKKDF